MHLWDGQSLLDEVFFQGEYKDKGFLLLRNHFAKTAAFNTKLQAYLNSEENKDVTFVYDKFGDKMNKSDVLMVTTKNSMKIFKYTDEILKTCIHPGMLKYLDKLDDATKELEKERIVWKWYKKEIKKKMWGICKYEKGSKFDDYQQLAYQFINSLNLSKDDVRELAKESLYHVSLMNKYPAFFKKYLGEREEDNVKSAMMINLLDVNDNMIYTKWYKDYRKSQIDSLKARIKRGKLLIPNNDYCVLFGNAYEMLQATVGKKIESSLHDGFECWCPMFKDGEELTCFRSPHIAESNSTLLKNVYHKEFDKWFNLTDNIVIVNFWDKGALLTHKLNGCDVDSDSVLLGNSPTLLRKVKEAQNKLVPINKVPAKPQLLEFNNINMAKVDSDLCNPYIGKVCNMAQQLQSLYWHVFNNNNDKEELLNNIYDDICILEVLSNIAIDSAKRQYDCNIGSELARIRKRDYLINNGVVLKDKSIQIIESKNRQSITSGEKEKFDEIVRKLQNLNEELSKCNNDKLTNDISRRIKELEEEKLKITTTEVSYIAKPNFFKNVQPVKRNNRVYYKLDAPMDILGTLVDSEIEPATRVDTMQICEILLDVKYDNVDSNRVRCIRDESIKAKKLINELYAKQKEGKMSWEEVYKQKVTIENAVVKILCGYKVTVEDISRLIRDVYDFQYKLDDKDVRIKDDNGNYTLIKDKRDPLIIQHKVGSSMLQWLYDAHGEIFIQAIKSNKGSSTHVIEDAEGEFINLGVRYSIIDESGNVISYNKKEDLTTNIEM